MSIPVVSIPKSGQILRLPITEPLWDTEYISPSCATMDLFVRRAAFAEPELARELIGRTFKSLPDTNVRHACIVAPHNGYLLDRIVLYPSTEGVRDLAQYREAVEGYRQRATLEIMFGAFIFATFPLRDVMPNFSIPISGMRREANETNYDPSEAPDLTHRIGVSLSVSLWERDYWTDDQEKRVVLEMHHYPIVISKREDFRVRIIGAPSAPVGVRAYLVGTHMRALQG